MQLFRDAARRLGLQKSMHEQAAYLETIAALQLVLADLDSGMREVKIMVGSINHRMSIAIASEVETQIAPLALRIDAQDAINAQQDHAIIELGQRLATIERQLAVAEQQRTEMLSLLRHEREA